MKWLCGALMSVVLLSGAGAQQVAPSTPLDSNAERTRIEAERSREKSRYDAEEAGCYQRFAVNDCLREVRVRRRATFEEFRRQEIILDDADRRKRAGEQVEQIDQKMADHDESEAQKKQESANKAAEKQPGGAAVRGRASSSQALTPERRAQEKKAFDEKLKAAQERKAKRDKALAEKAGTAAKPLSDPP